MKRSKKIISLLLSLLMIVTSISLMAVNSFAATSASSFSYVTMSDGTVTITKYNGSSAYVEIPSEIDGKRVATIGSEAFQFNESIVKVMIPSTVVAVGSDAFGGCINLIQVTFEEGCKSIGNYAFLLCLSLESINLPSTLETIGEGAFYCCDSLYFLNIPSSVNSIGDCAMGYSYDESSSSLVRYIDFIICGYPGTVAQLYANDNGFEYRLFPDVPYGVWYTDAVKYNLERGYITGYSNGTFGPANNIQRQDFALILARIAGADLSAYEGQNGGFSDVPSNAYYSAAVAWAKDRGIVTGYSADNFGVGTYISREQICLILSRY
ncbi:MAG: leucine-rich repeat protein, partial [Ruminococcus sp.]|nr:leucine-rich repeat protein [Ruminococcus sp.]